jgi:hypothetical protein
MTYSIHFADEGYLFFDIPRSSHAHRSFSFHRPHPARACQAGLFCLFGGWFVEKQR